jgi:hypothetical protein
MISIKDIRRYIIMSMKPPGRKIYRTANGKHIDLDLLIQRNELTPAVGNAKVNARGDELGPGGKIVRKREDILKDYYNNTKGVIDEPSRKTQPEEPLQKENSIEPTVKNETKSISSRVSRKSTTTDTTPTDESWEEDIDGNFVKKGEK